MKTIKEFILQFIVILIGVIITSHFFFSGSKETLGHFLIAFIGGGLTYSLKYEIFDLKDKKEDEKDKLPFK
jgi:hypothetical protein